jgi:hypothetical protein
MFLGGIEEGVIDPARRCQLGREPLGHLCSASVRSRAGEPAASSAIVSSCRPAFLATAECA